MTDTPPGAIPMPVVPGLTDLEVFARGGYATVYRATQISVGREVAVKIENRTLDSERDQQRFVREARAAGRMSSHPHVVDLFDAGMTVEGHPYLIMEMCDGSYADRMRHSPLGAAEARDVGVKIADALADAHHLGVLHRDVKPANILYSRFNEPALADFGLAVLAEGRDSTVTLEVLTPAYAPPEMFKHEPPSPAVDVYALCATLYAVMHGKPPRWRADLSPSLITLMELFNQPIPDLPGIPQALLDILRQGMANNPAHRPTAERLRDQLAAVSLGQTAGPVPGAASRPHHPAFSGGGPARPAPPVTSAGPPVSPAGGPGVPGTWHQPRPAEAAAPGGAVGSGGVAGAADAHGPSRATPGSGGASAGRDGAHAGGGGADGMGRRWDPAARPEAASGHPPPGPPVDPWAGGAARSAGAPPPGSSGIWHDDHPTVRTAPVTRAGRLRRLLVGLAALVLLAGATFGGWLLARPDRPAPPSGQGTESPAPPSASPVGGPSAAGPAVTTPAGGGALPGCLAPLPGGGRCLAELECFGPVRVSRATARADRLSCTGRHTWEAYAAGELSAEVDAADHEAVKADPVVRQVCSVHSFRTTTLRMTTTGWYFEVLPPTAEAVAAGDRSFRCLAGRGVNELTGPTLAG